MSNVNVNRFGRPYVKTVEINSVDEVPKTLQRGQWVRVKGDKVASRFVQYSAGGSAVLVRPVGKGRSAKGSMAAFRLASDKGKVAVLGTVGKPSLTQLLNLFL